MKNALLIDSVKERSVCEIKATPVASAERYEVFTRGPQRQPPRNDLVSICASNEQRQRQVKQRAQSPRGKRLLAEHKRGKTLRLGRAKLQAAKEYVCQARAKVAWLKERVARLGERLKSGSTPIVFDTKKTLLREQQQEQTFGLPILARLAELDPSRGLWCRARSRVRPSRRGLPAFL